MPGAYRRSAPGGAPSGAVPPARGRWRPRAAAAGALVACLVAPPRAQDLTAPLPLDSAIHAGTLPNGLTFLIRRNGKPENRLSLRLAVKAGSIDEADDQRGLAHVLEHMAFNGTAHFKPGELVQYLESIGAQFGPHVNAYTSFDETVYMLDVPTDRPGVVARAFEALGDFAGGLTLDPAEIDRERGVVIEEWRGRLGAGTRMQEAQLKALFGDSRYVERLPIGTPEVLKRFRPERLRDFYRDHYRPDRMAVVVVGDIDPGEAERRVRDRFGALAGRASPPRPAHPLPPHQETRYLSLSDAEAQGSSVSITHKRRREALRTASDYRRALVRGLAHHMLNARFAEIARQPAAPFLGAGSSDETLGRTVEAFSLQARVRDGELGRGLEALGREIARLRQHGFGEAELERAKVGTLTAYERAFKERSNAESQAFASELLRYFLSDEASPGIERELDLVRRFLPSITAPEAGALVRSLLGDSDRVVIAVAPDKAGLAPATEVALRDALRAGTGAEMTAWRDEIAGRALMASRPSGGTVRARREIAEIGATVLTLSNGVEVWLKPTDFRNDQIVFTSYARGGLSVVPEAEYHNAALATSLVGLAGVGGLSPIDRGKLLAGRAAAASPYVSSYAHGVSGSAAPRDLETALQLVYLTFTAPNPDPAAFDLLTERLAANLANQAESPGAVFGERVRRVNTSDHYTARAMQPGDLARLDAGGMLAFYRDRFANAADFTFFFVGTFEVDAIAPPLAAYLGSLPSRGAADGRIGPMRLQFPSSVRREIVTKGREPRSQTVLTFFADTGLDELEVHRAQAAASVLEARLRDILRERLGGTYSVGVGYSNTSPVPGYATISVQFGSAPENADALVGAVMAEIDRLRREGPSDSDVRAVKESEKNDLQEALRQNGYWLNSLQAMHLLGRDARRIPLRLERAESLSRGDVHAVFRRYFPPDRHTIVTLMPESTPAAAGQ
jgi:zinc protease